VTSLPFIADDPAALPVWTLRPDQVERWAAQQPPAFARWVASAGFRGESGRILPLPDREGGLAGVVLGLGKEDVEPWPHAALTGLPPGRYRLADRLDAKAATRAALGFALGTYQFTRYREAASPPEPRLLVAPELADLDHVRRTFEAISMVRDLVNTPASDMGPAELAAAALEVAARHGADANVIVGDDLLDAGYPMVHAVGRASTREPRLIDIVWGEPDAPKVTLVGKGVCFDSGGLDIKPSSAMLLMKKDMGGAANVLGLAHMIMDAELPVRLRVLIPAVENAVSGSAFRPGDVLNTRKGLTVEIGNTDAEGRLILADALAEADEEKPDLLVDMATLTGAARVALGPDLPALFTPDQNLAEAIAAHGEAENDPTWRLPLWAPYARMLDSKVADLNNVSDGSFAGAVTAALFLQRFVTDTPSWVHFDLFAWNPKAGPGRPVGGEAMTIRALYALVAERFAA
jgi:leucyl aminopeptidase